MKDKSTENVSIKKELSDYEKLAVTTIHEWEHPQISKVGNSVECCPWLI